MDKLRRLFLVWRSRRELRRMVNRELAKCARLYGVGPRGRFELHLAYKRRVVAAVLAQYDACRVSHG
jgi:hypothetical protein